MRELNFSHKKSRGIIGNHTAEYSYEHSKNQARIGAKKAIQAVRDAIRTGRLKSLKENIILCVYCGYRATLYEHRDYNKPLDVLPCCRSCNAHLKTATPLRA